MTRPSKIGTISNKVPKIVMQNHLQSIITMTCGTNFALLLGTKLV